MSHMSFSNVSSASCITMKNIQMSFTFLQNNSHTKLYEYIIAPSPEMLRSIQNSGIFSCVRQKKWSFFFVCLGGFLFVLV